MSLLGRGPQDEQCNYTLNTKDTQVYQNIALKSRYCSDELKENKGEYSTSMSGKKRSNSKNTAHSANPRVVTEVKRNDSHCDVAFLRKLLAMNKKEELILNRKLAKLVLEEEFGLGNEGSSCTKNLFSNTQFSNLDSKREKNIATLNGNKVTKVNHPLGCISANKSKNDTTNIVRTEYDLNGRRIYYDSDNCEDSEEDITIPAKCTSGSEDESYNPSVKYTTGSSKTYINTMTVIKTKSDITCDSLSRGKEMSSRRNSVTLMNQPILLEKKEDRVRRKQEESTADESKYKKCLFTKVDAAGKGCSKERESTPGDGVQNVVAHCCEVAQDKISSDSKKKVLKVWNFNDIPKVKPTKLGVPNTKTLYGVEHLVQSPPMSNKDKEMKSSKNSQDENSTQQILPTRNMFRKRKIRPNTGS